MREPTIRICVIDGRGGGFGRRLIEQLKARRCDRPLSLLGLATNRKAAEAMADAGADWVRVGEEALVRSVQDADIIMASLNVVIPGSMLGEITPAMAHAILRASGHKLLVPIKRDKLEVIGTEFPTLASMIDLVVTRAQVLMKSDRSEVPIVASDPVQNSQTTRV